MFHELDAISRRPAPFSHQSAADLWTDEHTSARMLAYHLDGAVDVSSRRTAFLDRSTAWIASRFALDATRSVADFGCGPGLYATRFARTGATVTGIDFSERSIRYARDRARRDGLAITYVQADYLAFETTRRFDLITMIMCDFCALGPEQRRSLLETFRAHLAPGGRVLFDVYSLAAFAAREESATYERNQMDGFWSPDPYFGFLNVFKYDAEKVVLDKYTIVAADRTRTVYNWLQCYDPDALAAELAAAGLAVEELLGDVAGGAYDPTAAEFAVVAGP